MCSSLNDISLSSYIRPSESLVTAYPSHNFLAGPIKVPYTFAAFCGSCLIWSTICVKKYVNSCTDAASMFLNATKPRCVNLPATPVPCAFTWVAYCVLQSSLAVISDLPWSPIKLKSPFCIKSKTLTPRPVASVRPTYFATSSNLLALPLAPVSRQTALIESMAESMLGSIFL